MPRYGYFFYDLAFKKIKHETLETLSIQDFFDQTRDKKIIFYHKKKSFDFLETSKLSHSSCVLFLEHFHFLLSHHVLLDDCLKECPPSFDAQLTRRFYLLKQDLEYGKTLRQALQNATGLKHLDLIAFDYYELSGNIHEAFQSTLFLLKEKKAFSQSVIQKSLYPLFVLGVLMVVMIFFSVQHIPQLLEVFHITDLPLLTRFFLKTGTFLYDNIFEIGLFVSLFFLTLSLVFKRFAYLSPVQRIKNKLQGFYFLVLLYKSDVPLQALFKALCSFEKPKKLTLWKNVERYILNGKPLSTALELCGFSKTRICRLVLYGEQTGDLKKFLESAYALEMDYWKKKDRYLLKPLKPTFARCMFFITCKSCLYDDVCFV